MKFIASITASLFFASTFAKYLQSEKFYLVLQSSNSSLNGRTLEAGHEGAAIEGLLPSKPLSEASEEYNTYYYNYTKEQPNQGLLIWELISDGYKDSEAMGIYPELSTNVGIALFEPGSDQDSVFVSFNSDNEMYIKTYYNDTVVPPIDGKVSDLYRWQICEYDFEGYVYDVLCWIYGDSAPQNPSCKPVGVKRVFNK